MELDICSLFVLLCREEVKTVTSYTCIFVGTLTCTCFIALQHLKNQPLLRIMTSAAEKLATP